jgi:23S rRNA pseudouridine1911/1915/1917 synthase
LSNSPAGKPLAVLYEDNHLLVVDKPAGLLTQSDKSGEDSLLEICRRYVRSKYDKQGNVFIGMVHRLDRPVSGVIVFARTSKAASRLSALIRKGEMEKTYRAVVDGCLEGEGVLEDYLVREGDKTRKAEAIEPEAQKAILKYRSISAGPEKSFLEIDLVTGRKHQIRAQLSQIGHPVLGDRKYGSPVDLGKDRIALMSYKLTFKHPTREEILTFTANEPDWWPWSKDKDEGLKKTGSAPE